MHWPEARQLLMETAPQSRRMGPGVSSLGGWRLHRGPHFPGTLVTCTDYQEGGPDDFKGYFSSNFCSSSWFWKLIPTLWDSSFILRLNSVHFEIWMSVQILLYLKNVRKLKVKTKTHMNVHACIHTHTHIWAPCCDWILDRWNIVSYTFLKES